MQRGRCHGKREPAGRVLSTTANKRQGNETEERGPAPLPRRTLLSPSPPPEREHADWRVRVCAHANDGCALEAVDGTSEQDRAPRKRAVSLAQCASMGHGPTPTSAAERARAASAHAAPPPEGEHAEWRTRVCAHANAGCSLEAVDGTSKQGRAPREMAVSLAQWASIEREPTPTSATERARRRKRACCASFF